MCRAETHAELPRSPMRYLLRPQGQCKTSCKAGSADSPQSAHRWSDWLVIRAARRRSARCSSWGSRRRAVTPVSREASPQIANEAVPAGSCRRCRTRMPIVWDGARPRRPDRGLPVVVRPSGSSISPRRTPIRSTVTSRCKPQRKGGGRRRPMGCGRSSVSPRHKPGFTNASPDEPRPSTE